MGREGDGQLPSLTLSQPSGDVSAQIGHELNVLDAREVLDILLKGQGKSRG